MNTHSNFQDITQSLRSMHDSPPKTDQCITNKWTSEKTETEARTTNSFCSRMHCASHIIGHIIGILWDTNQASPSRALGVWIIHANCHKRHSSHWQQCTSRSGNNMMFFLVSRAISRSAALLAKALMNELPHFTSHANNIVLWHGQESHAGDEFVEIIIELTYSSCYSKLYDAKGGPVCFQWENKFQHVFFNVLPVSLALQSCQYCLQSACIISFPGPISWAVALLPLCTFLPQLF